MAYLLYTFLLQVVVCVTQLKPSKNLSLLFLPSSLLLPAVIAIDRYETPADGRERKATRMNSCRTCIFLGPADKRRAPTITLRARKCAFSSRFRRKQKTRVACFFARRKKTEDYPRSWLRGEDIIAVIHLQLRVKDIFQGTTIPVKRPPRHRHN